MFKSRILSAGSWYPSLGRRFILLVVIVLASTMGVTTLVNYNSQNSLFLQNLQNKGSMVGRFLAEISVEAILSYDFVTLNDYVRDVTGGEDIVYAVIVSPDGKNMTSYLDFNDPYLRQISTSAELTQVMPVIKQLNSLPEIISMEFPILFGGKALGNVVLGMTSKRVNDLSRQDLYRQLLGSGFIILFLAACIFLVFRISALRPIVRLVEGYRRVSQGDLDTVVNVSSDDELGRLALAFNKMVAKLKASTQEKDTVLVQLQDLNANLESRVEERTQELAIVNKELEHLALHDPLTNLPNRSLIQDRLQQCVFEAKRDKHSFSVIMMDLDRFKEVNDTLGHNFGDLLLMEVGQRLRQVIRETDTFGRLGGDEFAVILPGADIETGMLVANKLLTALEDSINIDGMELSISASLGIASFPEHGVNPSSLLKSADVAMYEAKQNKEGYCVYQFNNDPNTPRRLSLMGELRRAVAEDTLSLAFQPKIHLQSKKVIGAEVLLRWQHPDKGFIPPDEFIPLAEQTGLIKPLTEWVIRNAFESYARWCGSGLRVPLAINLSMYNLRDNHLPGFVNSMLAQHHVQSSDITFEITEGTIMHDPLQTMKILSAMEDMGICLSIDDFGTGYSSLSNLKKLPVHELKIDKAFVMDMASDNDDVAIVRTIIDLASNLRLSVVAEGVESEHAFELLKTMGCDSAQGYFISKPIFESEFLQFVAQRKFRLEPQLKISRK